MVAYEEGRDWGDEGTGVSRISLCIHFYIIFVFELCKYTS